jgi:hypothetical protein
MPTFFSACRAWMAVFARDPRWRLARTGGSRAWTDDYTNVLGAMIAKSLR